MDNKCVVERLFQLQVAVQSKNTAVASAFQRATISLLEYGKPLAAATKEDLLSLKGIGPGTVPLIQRLIAGEDIEAIVADVPTMAKVPRGSPTSYVSRDRGNWDGSWDNSVRSVEGD